VADRLLAFEDAVGLLKSGGVLLLGTDTLPGFHCRADLPESIARIQALKGRQSGKSMLVLAGSADQAGLVTGTLDERQTAFCRSCWPGPFSLILPATEGVTVAVRVPALESLCSLVLAVGFPLVSTSANLSGNSPYPDFEAALAGFSSQVDGAWNPRESRVEGAGSMLSGPSALIDVTTWPPVQLRQGPMDPPPL
jgi:L-threonylcarbamoyladenylate synthase